MYCPRCKGILGEKQTKVLINDTPHHYFCAFKIFEEEKENRDREYELRKEVKKDLDRRE